MCKCEQGQSELLCATILLQVKQISWQTYSLLSKKNVHVNMFQIHADEYINIYIQY